MRDDPCHGLTEGLSKNVALKTIILKDNKITDDGLRSFTKKFKDDSIKHLKHLDLAANMLSKNEGPRFAAALIANSELESLNLTSNFLEDATAVEFIETLKIN